MKESTRRRLRRRMCASKNRYPDHARAVLAIWKVKRERPGTLLRAYECPHRKGWHLSSKDIAPAEPPS